MAIRSTIFDTDPEFAEQQAKRAAASTHDDGTVGRFSAGVQDADGNPLALSEWRFATGDRAVADAIAQALGGAPQETDSTSENFIEVLTSSTRIPVILAGADALDMDYKLWNSGELVHHCDGSNSLLDDDNGAPCGCPKLMSERKLKARSKRGPKPSITVFFRLADDPELGLFKVTSGSWSTAGEMHIYDHELGQVGGEAAAELVLEHVEYVPKQGPMAGKLVSYNYPKLERIRSLNSAIAEAA